MIIVSSITNNLPMRVELMYLWQTKYKVEIHYIILAGEKIHVYISYQDGKWEVLSWTSWQNSGIVLLYRLSLCQYRINARSFLIKKTLKRKNIDFFNKSKTFNVKNESFMGYKSVTRYIFILFRNISIIYIVKIRKYNLNKIIVVNLFVICHPRFV